MIARPDGGLTLSGLPVSELILGAYVSDVLPDVVGLPDWASRGRYEVSATASLVREQLGLKLEPSRAALDTLVIDHLERPTEN